MLLAIDAGNTNTLFAVHDGERFRAQWRSATKDTKTADEFIVWLSNLMELENLKIKDVDAAIIASVVPQSLFNLRSLCRKYFQAEPLVVGEPGIDVGLRINMDRPQDVGADRLVNAVAAHKIYGGPLIVIDFGTATTFDVVSKTGDYEGGVISPGVNTSLEALHLAAAQLPRIEVTKPQRVIGDATTPAMQSGTYWGYLGLIEGLVARIKEEYDEPMKVVATGGLANLFRNATSVIEDVNQDLTIEGLLAIYKLNTTP
jgi:type III pantothenate kinase